MNIGNLELTFNPVDPNAFGITENDRTAYADGVRDVIDLDAVLVASSANIYVSPCFFQPATEIDTSYE